MKKVKHVVQFASYAAYHLSRETSFFADEGASLPKAPWVPSIPELAKILDTDTRLLKNSTVPVANQSACGGHRTVGSCTIDTINLTSPSTYTPSKQGNISSVNNFVLIKDLDGQSKEPGEHSDVPDEVRAPKEGDVKTTGGGNLEFQIEHETANKGKITETCGMNEITDYFSTADSQSILVSLSTTCVLKGTVCEPSQLFRIKFYGSFDKPLGRYLRDDLFDQVIFFFFGHIM